MTLLSVVSFLVVVFSTAAKGGIAHQVWKNHKRKSTSGISVPFFTIGIFSYSSLALLGVLIRSLPVVLSALPGVFLNLVVVCQVLWYSQQKVG